MDSCVCRRRLGVFLDFWSIPEPGMGLGRLTGALNVVICGRQVNQQRAEIRKKIPHPVRATVLRPLAARRSATRSGMTDLRSCAVQAGRRGFHPAGWESERGAAL